MRASVNPYAPQHSKGDAVEQALWLIRSRRCVRLTMRGMGRGRVRRK
jgi:hypothetical protein